MVMPYLTPGEVQCVTLMIWVIMIQNFDIYISWSTKMIGAYCGIQELLTKQKN